MRRWSDAFGPHRFLGPLVLVSVVGMAALAWAVRDPLDTEVASLLLGATLVGISYGALQNLTLVLAFQSVSRTHYGSASALWNVGYDGGTGLGAVMIGAIAAGSSYSVALLIGGALCLLTLPLTLIRRAPAQSA